MRHALPVATLPSFESDIGHSQQGLRHRALRLSLLFATSTLLAWRGAVS